MDMNWVVLTIAVTAVAWIVIRRQLKKKEAAPQRKLHLKKLLQKKKK